MTTPRRIGVLSVGNVLMGDDAIGPYLLKLLEARYTFPENVVLQDLGTPGLGITPFFADFDVIVLLDAVQTSDAPGTVKLYHKKDLLQIKVQPRVSPHDPALVEALFFSELGGKCPEDLLLVGVVPKACELGCSMSEDMHSAEEPALVAVLAELEKWGAAPRLRAEPQEPNLWWREPVAQLKEEAGEVNHVSGHSR